MSLLKTPIADWFYYRQVSRHHIFTRSYCKVYQTTHIEIQWHKRNWFIMKSKTCTMMNSSVFRDEKTMKEVCQHGMAQINTLFKITRHLTSGKVKSFWWTGHFNSKTWTRPSNTFTKIGIKVTSVYAGK